MLVCFAHQDPERPRHFEEVPQNLSPVQGRQKSSACPCRSKKLNRTCDLDTGCRHDFVILKVRRVMAEFQSCKSAEGGEGQASHPAVLMGQFSEKKSKLLHPNLWAGCNRQSQWFTALVASLHVRCNAFSRRSKSFSMPFSSPAASASSADPDGRIHQSFSHHTIKEGTTFISRLQ